MRRRVVAFGGCSEEANIQVLRHDPWLCQSLRYFEYGFCGRL
jgi:hypothetical protein